MDRASHWNGVYETKRPDGVSWYQARVDRSLGYIRELAPVGARIVDVGGGASLLVDALLDGGYLRPIVLDVSASGLEHARSRLGGRASFAEWVVADVTRHPALPPVGLWHDRAVLHFLVDPADQCAYAELAAATILPGGHLVLATFAPDGPEKCSGLAVQRHDGATLAVLLGSAFELVREEREVHITPGGTEQRFCWTLFRRR